ncbi:peptidoglycan-binding protein [Bathymodiolus thermophilus thioautotrophic gill symbiont]|uniref:Fibronectin type-III domain-containing protein n=1 Tax=Bathymodiolus thermophilus thioautotrophic gill symbiont TaxID=2360 RepID=A0A8H9CF81_9GAMM|nr:peptidoglycan-binding protein [Bathymodiolus thermophilus thioautotrophic gill symbiont]CAB5497191.1 hypothetical protein THERMOS_642 [Bathymodiolus thermophilus thioautotrophic gill symbiont]
MILKTLVTILILTLAACGGGENGSSSGGGNNNQNLNTGVFVDSEVEGLEYFTSSGITGLTNSKGEFNYANNDIVAFKLGNLSLGSVGVSSDNNIVMPSSLLNSYGQLRYDNRVNIGTNIGILLQSIDNDRNHDNGIQIPQYFRDRFNSDNLLDLKASSDIFGNKLELYLNGLPSINDSIVRENIAKSLKEKCTIIFGNLKAKNQPDCNDMADNLLLAIYAERYANIARNYEYVINDIKAGQNTSENLEKAIKSATDLGASLISIYENKDDMFKLGIETLKAMLTSFREVMNLLDNAEGKESFSAILNIWKLMTDTAFCVSDGRTNIDSCSKAVYDAISIAGNIYKISESDVNKSVQIFLQYSELLKYGAAIHSLAESNRGLLIFLIAIAPENEHAAKILFNTIALAKCGKDVDFSQCVSGIGTSLATTVHDIYASTDFLSKEQAIIKFTRNNVIYALLIHAISENMAGKEGYTKNKILSIINQAIEHNNINPVELDNRSIYNYFITPVMNFFQSEEGAKEDFRNSKVVSSVYDFIKNSPKILKAMKSGLRIGISKNKVSVREAIEFKAVYRAFPSLLDKFQDRSVDLVCNKNGSIFLNEKINLQEEFSKLISFNQTGGFDIECEIILIKGIKINKEYVHINVTDENISTPKKPTLVSPGSSNSPGSILTNLKPTLSWNAVNDATYYKVAIRDVNTGDLVLNKINVVGSSLVVSNSLTARHQYYWNIVACDDAGCGTWAEPLYFQIEGGQDVPSAPNTTGEYITYEAIVIYWDAVDGATKYQLELEDIGNSDIKTVEVTTESGGFTNLISEHDYKIRVKAYNLNGYSDFSPYKNFTTKKNIPDAPSLIIVKVEDLNAIMAWQEVDGADRYRVRVYDLDGNDNRSEYVDKNEIIISNLTAGHRYKVKIKARVNGNYGNYSNYEHFEIAEVSLPLSPSAIYVDENYPYTTIYWAEVFGVDIYDICISEAGNSGDCTSFEKSTSNSKLSLNDSEIDSGKNYKVKIRSRVNNIIGNYSSDKSFSICVSRYLPDAFFYTLQKSENYDDNVEKVQHFLSYLGYSLIIDGYFGDNTYNVVKDYQSKYGLSSDGKVGANTIAHMRNTCYR